jgi:hypothetical protein
LEIQRQDKKPGTPNVYYFVGGMVCPRGWSKLNSLDMLKIIIYKIVRWFAYGYCKAMSEVERKHADDRDLPERRRLIHLQNANAAEAVMKEITIQRAAEKYNRYKSKLKPLTK